VWFGKRLKTKNQSRAATLKILLDHKVMLEEALLSHGQACVEVYFIGDNA
jgi:hypothetical protein